MPESPEQLRARLRAEIAAIEKGIPKPSRAPDLPHVREEREDRRPSRASRSLSASAAGGQPSRHDAGEVDEDVRLSDPDAAFRKIERLCLVRERASEQLRQRLAREGFEAGAVEAALDRALACGLVYDGRFADVLVRSRLAQGRGRRGIAAELESLGIDADGVEALAAADDDAGEVDRSRCSTASRREPPRLPTAASPERLQRLGVIHRRPPLVRGEPRRRMSASAPSAAPAAAARPCISDYFLSGLLQFGHNLYHMV
ncbi:MAG: regulatory protein RecX [Eggerthella lenta]